MINEQVFELLEATDLNWTVNKEPLQTMDGKPTESFGIYRNDNNMWLGTVGKQYTPFQNYELAHTIVSVARGVNLNFEKGGSLKGGEKIFFQAELPQTHIGNSGVQRWLTACNSHDGSTSIAFGSSSTVIVCENTFFRAYKNLQKFRHTVTAKQRIDAAIADMRVTLKLDEQLMQNFKRMAETRIADEVFHKVMQSAFDADLNAKSDSISTRKMNQLKTVNSAIETEVATHGYNLWALFNGVTRYTNHMAVSRSEREEYVMAGGGYRTNLTTFNEIMKWLDANTDEAEMLVAELVS